MIYISDISELSHVHIDSTKIVLCQYLFELTQLVLEMIKQSYINLNLCTNDS